MTSTIVNGGTGFITCHRTQVTSFKYISTIRWKVIAEETC